eukprot:3050850-Pleurochrysis_carterae.AAC.5
MITHEYCMYSTLRHKNPRNGCLRASEAYILARGGNYLTLPYYRRLATRLSAFSSGEGRHFVACWRDTQTSLTLAALQSGRAIALEAELMPLVFARDEVELVGALSCPSDSLSKPTGAIS